MPLCGETTWSGADRSPAPTRWVRTSSRPFARLLASAAGWATRTTACPNCHSSLVYPGDKHWDGVEFPWECAVCGAGGDIVTDERTGRPRLKIAENGLIRDRNDDCARAEHLNEINKTRDEFFAHMDEVKPLMEKYAKMTFPTLEIKRD